MQILSFTISLPVPDCACTFVVWLVLLYRKIRYGYAFRKIWLTKGMYAMVDQVDYERINKLQWHSMNSHDCTFYAVRRIYINGRKKLAVMHREIMQPPADLVVDHADGNGLNNTRKNLRIATPAENSYNRRKHRRKCSSKYKGVHMDKRTGRWRTIIIHKGKSIHLGMFENEIDAAKAYDKAAKELYGEFAKLNFE
jgi:hypothetical protein